MNRAWLRWLPAVVVPGVIAAGVLVVPSSAGAAFDLPVRTGEQVLAMVAESSVRALSGTLVQTANLGLPQLPAGESATGADAASAVDLLTGSHTARIYVDGPTNARLQVMDTLGERDVVRRANDVWFYSYQTNAAVHLTLPTRAAAGDVARGDVPTPAQLARRFLASVDPSTDVTVGNDTTVAGRAAYDLLLRPRDGYTLVESVSVAVDSETGLPLRFRVQARGQVRPAFELAFTSLSLRAPAADRFTFVPPPGATVREQAIAAGPATTMSPGTAGSVGDSLALLALLPAVSGSGWDAVIELPAGTVPSEVTSAPLVAQLTRAVTGGRLLQMTLVNVLVTDDGRAFVGSVPLDRLQSAAAGT